MKHSLKYYYWKINYKFEKVKRIIGFYGLILCELFLIIYGIYHGFDSDIIKALIFSTIFVILSALTFLLGIK